MNFEKYTNFFFGLNFCGWMKLKIFNEILVQKDFFYSKILKWVFQNKWDRSDRYFRHNEYFGYFQSLRVSNFKLEV